MTSVWQRDTRPRLTQTALAEVSIEQLRLAYANLPVSQAVAALNGIVLAIVLSSVTAPAPLIGWLTPLIALTSARLYAGVLFRRATHSTNRISSWRRMFLAGAVASGLVWGSTGWVLYPVESVLHQVFIALVVGGMVVGAVAALTPVFSAFVLFAACAVLPLIARFLWIGDNIHNAMAGMAALFVLAMLIIGKHIHETINGSLILRAENRDLIADLTNTTQRVEALNRDLLSAQEKLTRVNLELEARVSERTAALETADRRKDEILAALSHELRNPLAPIRNAIYILDRVDTSSEHAQRAKEVIERQTQHMTRLVEDLLDVTRIARGKIAVRRECADLTSVVRRTVQDHSSVFTQAQIELLTHIAERPLWASIDPTRIAQLVGNLLQNASKFTPMGGQVTVSLDSANERAEIRVSDTGAGIEPELLPMLFEPFIQGKQSLARTEGGLGLGLALVKGITELHSGTVHVESRGVGNGSTFIVRLPLSPWVTPEAMASTAVEAIQPQRHVLVVDDNIDAAESLAELVRMFGHRAEVAYDGTSALHKTRAKVFDVVLCDLGLPDITGYEVAKALRACAKDIRLIAVSGYARPQDVSRASDAGFEHHIAKPADPEALRRLIL